MDYNDFKFIIENAVKAPSGHNTQPWLFENIENGIIIHPDFSRTLPIVDGDNHALYISLGCALENILIAASQLGFESAIQYPNDSGDSIKVTFQINNTFSEGKKDPLYDYISSRQVNRGEYSDRKIASHVLQKLKLSFSLPGISLVLLDGRESFSNIIPLIIEGNNLQFENKQFINELTSWFRYSKTEAKRKKDGLWTAAMGLPNMGKPIGMFVMKNFVSAKSEAKRLGGILQHTQGLAIFLSEKDDLASWINTGRAFQRFGLTATQLGISHAHLYMPCEELAVRKKLAKKLNMSNLDPLLVIRYGYSGKVPYSFRRKVDEVILNHQ
ncbi:MAG: hypothetical protein AB1777_08655 [Bacteroidota bacterium]